jgi:hypothetical protein
MTVDETLQLARSYEVEVRLNAAGDGLDLEITADPPEALMNVLRRAKWDIVATLRQQETEARANLGLEPLADLFERHHPLLWAVEDSRPPDAPNNQWQTALRGLRAFLAAGHGDAAEAAGWAHNELYSVPPVWSRVDQCGVGLLIGDAEVVEVAATEIRIKIPVSGSVQTVRRAPSIDYGLVYKSRLKQIEGNYPAGSDEPRLRAIEWAVAEYRRNTGADLAAATVAVQAVLRETKQ